MEIRDQYVDLGFDPGIKCGLMKSLQRCESYANTQSGCELQEKPRSQTSAWGSGALQTK